MLEGIQTGLQNEQESVWSKDLKDEAILDIRSRQILGDMDGHRLQVRPSEEISWPQNLLNHENNKWHFKLLTFGVVSCVRTANGAPWSSLKSMEQGCILLYEVYTEESECFLI